MVYIHYFALYYVRLHYIQCICSRKSGTHTWSFCCTFRSHKLCIAPPAAKGSEPQWRLPFRGHRHSGCGPDQGWILWQGQILYPRCLEPSQSSMISDIRSPNIDIERCQQMSRVSSLSCEHESTGWNWQSGAFCRGQQLRFFDFLRRCMSAWVAPFPSISNGLTTALCTTRMARQEGDNVGGCWIRKRCIVQEVCFTSMHI